MNHAMKLFLLLILLSSSIYSTDYFDWIPVKVRTQRDGLKHWVRSEAYKDHHIGFKKEKILPKTRFKNEQVLACFPKNLYGKESVDFSLMVLLYAPKWKQSTKTPILLIHGAGDNAFRAWVHPYVFETPVTVPSAQEGYMQKFVRAGYPVFAINFSNNQGDNYCQAEQIHNAIAVIKRKTGADKVNLIAHSKGNCAASIYLCGGKNFNPSYCNFISAYSNDVNYYLQLGAANKGIDLIYRYYAANLITLQQKASSPVCFHSALYYGIWQNFYKRDVYLENPGEDEGNYFPGQNQLLYDLVADGVGFSMQSYTPFDFNMTMKACYYGGVTTCINSYGIKHAIKEGGYTIQKINERGLNPGVKLLNVYGTKRVLQEIDLWFFKIPMGVSDYPSDGVIYVHSSSYVKGLLSRGAKLAAQKSFKENHIGITCKPNVFKWIDKQLSK